MKRYLILLFTFLSFILSGQEKISNDNELEAFKAAYNAYIWGYPLVARAVTTQLEKTEFNVLRTIDQRQKGDNNFDSFYLRADVDFSQGEFLLTIPVISPKYYSIMFSDAYGNIFGGVSSLKNPSKDPKVMLVGPKWNGVIPKGVKNLIKCPTNYAWIIVRSTIEDQVDLENAKKLFSGFSLNQIANNLNSKPWSDRFSFAPFKTVSNVNEQISAMDWKTYFNYLSKMMRENPWPYSQKEYVAAFERIGLNAYKDFDGSGNKSKAQKGIKQGILDAKELLKKEVQSKADFYKNGWSVNINEGKLGNNYTKTAAAAFKGFNQTPVEEMVKLYTLTDSENNTLDGTFNQYMLTFPKGQFPSSKAYWTIGVLTPQNGLYENTKNKYALNSKSKLLKLNKDGSLSIFFQNIVKVPKGFEANVLPIPAGVFKVVLKVISPDEIVKSGEWIPSAITISK